MRLYYHHLASPTVRKVRAVAFEADLVLDEIEIDYEAEQQRSSAYLALNPNAKFPTLVDGDFILWESNAICQYLATCAPLANLLPLDNERARTDVTRWQCWELSHFSPSVQKLLQTRSSMPSLDPSADEKADAEFRRYATVLDHHLRGRRFISGEQRTIADFCMASMLMYVDKARIPLVDFVDIARWFEGVQALAGWRRSQPQA